MQADLLCQRRAKISEANALNTITDVQNRLNIQIITELHQPLSGNRIPILTKKTGIAQADSCAIRNDHQDITFYQFTHKGYMHRTLFS